MPSRACGACKLPSARATRGCTERTPVWIEESGFYLLPACVRSYATRAQPPILRVRLSWDHLSAIGALSAAGHVLLQVYDRALRGPEMVRSLKDLLRHIPRKLLVLWHGSPTHRAQAVRDCLAHGGATRIHLEPLPSYAPEQNPQYGIWTLLKRVELRVSVRLAG